MSNTTQSAVELKETSINSFVSAFIFNTLVAILGFILFSLFHRRFQHVYLSSLILHTTQLFSELSETQVDIWNRLKTATSTFSWLTSSLKLSDEDIFDLVGFDIFVYLRFVRLCLKFFAIILPYGICVIIPLNIHGSVGLQGMSSLSMGNIELKSHIYWAHLAGVWAYSIVIYFLMYREWQAFTHYRQLFLQKGYEEQYNVLISDLPIYLRTEQNLKEFLNSIFPEKVISVHVFQAIPRWNDLIVSHDQMVRKYEHTQAIFKQNRKIPTHKKFIVLGTKTDLISFYEDKLKQNHEELKLEQSGNHNSLSTAVVTFKSLQDAAIGLQTSWNNSPTTSHVSSAPAASDIIWENIGLLPPYRTIRYVMVSVCLFLLVFFWSIPVFIVSSMVSLHALQKQFSFLEGVNDLPDIVKGFIEGLLATIVLEIFFSILPDLMAWLSRVEGIESKSRIAVSCIGKLFIFQIVNKFLGVLFGGALMSRLNDIIDYPTKIPAILAESMPSMANFFMKVLMLKTLTGYPMEILDLFRLILVTIKRKWFCKTVRENRETWNPPPVRFPGMYTNNLFVFIIGISYSILSPLLMVFALLHFALAYVVRSYRLVFVCKTSFKAGGIMWPKVFNRMMIGIFVFQLLMIGVFALKENVFVSSFCIPLPFFSFVFYKFIRKNFDRSTIYLNLSMAKEIRTPHKEYLKISSKKYNRLLFIPDVYELSTDNKTEVSNEEGPSRIKEDLETSQISKNEVELEKLIERNNQEQPV